MANAGRVAIVPKGDYSSSTAYNRLDLVRYNEKAYVAKKASTGVLPTNTDYWMLMTSDGIVIDSALSDTSTNPVQNKIIKNALDNIQTTSKATLSQAGWYRVAEYKSNANGAKGLHANSCKLFIKTVANNNTNESIELLLSSVLNDQKITALSVRKFSSTFIAFTKCRYVYDGTNAYLEVYYNLNVGNPCVFTVSDSNDYYNKWQAITPVATSETLDGVTVTTTYDIPANASPATSVDLANYLPNTGGAQYKADYLYNYLRTDLRNVLYGIDDKGVLLVLDQTNGKQIIQSTASGTTNFYGTLQGTATGNLPLTGGVVGNGAWSDSPLEVYGQYGTTKRSLIKYSYTGTLLGYMGFDYDGNPIILHKSAGQKNLHHDGNSAKVAIQESAPTDTSALWVDTANKVTKAYIDGAWTAMA